MREWKVTVGICTRNRPAMLQECLASIHRSNIRVHQVIVSDDSTDDVTRSLLCTYPGVIYLEGPRRGLSYNRNNILTQATGDYILFLDDDAQLETDFIRHCFAHPEAGDPDVLISGREKNHGTLVEANDQNYLGFQRRPYAGQAARTIVINSTLFPVTLFERIRFDERLVYGYDEVDIAVRATALGYRIVFVPDAVNLHFPSEINRDYYRPHVDASRIYVTFKRYAESDGNRLKASVYLLVSGTHLALTGLRMGGWRGFLAATKSYRAALEHIVSRRTS